MSLIASPSVGPAQRRPSLLPAEVPALRSQLVELQARHDSARRFAARARRGDWDGLAAVSSPKVASQVRRLYEAGVTGVVDGDGGQEVRRLRARIAALRAGQDELVVADNAPDGILVIEDLAAGFIQLVFAAKVSPAVRKLLKRQAFRFSALNEAWCRRLDGGGRDAAAQVIAAMAAGPSAD